MNIRKIALGLGLTGMLYASGCSAEEATPKPSDPPVAVATPEPTEEPKVEEKLTLEQIAEYMKRDSVEDILEGSGVSYVNDDSFDRLVTNGNKPSVVMFYTPNHESPTFKREAIILRALQERFDKKINFYAFALTRELVRSIERSQPNEYGLTGAPSLALYHNIDFAKEDNSEDGEYRQIDILRGGPSRNKIINEWISGKNDKDDDCVLQWILSNLVKPKEDGDGNKYTIKYNNSASNNKNIFKW